ncbi:potassium channel, sub T, member 2 [Rhizophlyctis rosea]|nr:potassium channel, sub T, member 2 [Rhizophlyctis rosea]
MSIIVLPGLISNTVETFVLQRAGGGSYGGMQPFVVICGTFENPVRFMDVLNSLLNRELSNDKLSIVFMARSPPTQFVKTVLSEVRYKNRVVYLQGSALDATDIERVKLQRAEAAFILPDKTVEDRKQEDEHNTLRAWSFSDHAPDVPLFVYNLLPETETFQLKTATAVVCIDSLKQILIGYNCLYEGAGTLLINLLQNSTPSKSYTQPWQAEYGDGSGNEVYSVPMNALFVGQRFCDVSWYLFREFQIILFAVNAYVHRRNVHHVMLNPGRYELGARDQLLVIAQDWDYCQKIIKLTSDEYSRSIIHDGDTSSAELQLSLHETEFPFQTCRPVAEETGFPPVGDGKLRIGQPDPPYADARVPLCRLLRHPPHDISAIQITSAADMVGHLLVATGSYNVFRLLTTLRSAHVDEEDFRPVLFMCNRAPNEEEFAGMAPFPMVYWIMGDPRKKRDLLRAGVEGAEKVVVLDIPCGVAKAGAGGDAGGDFADSGAIMVSHLIHDIFYHTKRRKYVVTELGRRSHIKFLRPTVTRRNKHHRKLPGIWADDFLYAPVYAAGRVLVGSMLDSILFQTYHNSSILEMFKLMCGVRYQAHNDLDKLLGIHPAYLSNLDLPEGYEGKTFSSLYCDLALKYGIIPIGLLRDVMENDETMGNKLPFVVTNPPPSLLLKREDKVYVLRAVRLPEVGEEGVGGLQRFGTGGSETLVGGGGGTAGGLGSSLYFGLGMERVDTGSARFG